MISSDIVRRFKLDDLKNRVFPVEIKKSGMSNGKIYIYDDLEKKDELAIISAISRINKQSENITLADKKRTRINEVDDKTRILLAQGYTHDGNTFSFSLEAQANLVGFQPVKNAGMYPQGWTTMEDEVYTINNVSEFDALYNSALGRKKYILDGGRDLKIQIKSCTTESELNAITDNRV